MKSYIGLSVCVPLKIGDSHNKTIICTWLGRYHLHRSHQHIFQLVYLPIFIFGLVYP